MAASQTTQQSLTDDSVREGGAPPAENGATMQPVMAGCTLQDLASTKSLPKDDLEAAGWSDFYYCGMPAVRIPYKDQHGAEKAVRFRTGLDHDGERFRWKSGDRPCPYGLHELDGYDPSVPLFLVEGETDTITMRLHGYQALGVPGASTWRNEWAQDLEGFDQVFLVVEPDQGGTTLSEKLASSPLAEKLHLVRMCDLSGDDSVHIKDVNDLHQADPLAFTERFDNLVASSISAVEASAADVCLRAREAWETCKDLAHQPDILVELVDSLKGRLVGQDREAQILYLALTSRVLDRPVSVIVKGPSSGGKSYLVEQVVRYFPESAYLPLTSMSDKALIYMDDPLEHRFLVLYEAAGMAGETVQYIVRSLLSEGEINYKTVMSGADGPVPFTLHKDGPTGLVMTTTRVKVHPENETRLLSLAVLDTPDQTAAILRAIGEQCAHPDSTDRSGPEPSWAALQVFLQSVPSDVVIPFATEVAKRIPPSALRLRRDVTVVFNLIKAHAILHQATRSRDEDERIVATIEDYARVYDLIGELLAENIEAAVSRDVRETVEAVRRLHDRHSRSVMITEVAGELKLDRSTASRRAKKATSLGYLRNEESRPGRPAQLTLGEDIPSQRTILPAPELLSDCVVAPPQGLGVSPSPPDHYVHAGIEATFDPLRFTPEIDDRVCLADPLGDRPALADEYGGLDQPFTADPFDDDDDPFS